MTSCPDCIASARMTVIENFTDEARDRGVDFWTVAIDAEHIDAVARSYVAAEMTGCSAHGF